MLQNVAGPADEKTVRIAYILVAHHRPDAVIRLVRRLYAPSHGFFIHYDVNSRDADIHRIAEGLKGFENVKFLKRFKCGWGQIGIVRAWLEGIAELARLDFIYDYAIHVSGLDYPIKSNAQIQARLASAAGRSYMESMRWPIPDWEKGRAIKRIENYHIHLPVPYWLRKAGWQPAWQHLTIPMKRKIPGGLHPYFGSAFWCLHRNCQQYIHEYVMRHPEHVDFFIHTLNSDESLFQMLVMNSPLAATVNTHTLTYVQWRFPWPGIMVMDDLPRLRQSECLFARKFDSAVDARIIGELDSLNEPAFSLTQ